MWESSETRLLHPKTTLIRTARSHYSRLQTWLSRYSIPASRTLRSLPRLRTAICLYLIVLHIYVMFGCFLGLL
ncbi:hypothetical protein LSAT2_013015 [Lamellibrachia satsuma]|nr:hypothetical protein LSAT2_013015 [Lamellibrachia satsuma]